jgi:hypothetical protein
MEAILEQLTLCAEDSLAKTSVLQDAARDWLESEAGFGMSTIAFLQRLGRNGLSSRMSPACYPAGEDGTLPSSFEGWSNSGMASPGGYLTLSISESPSGGAACSLSAVLETDVPRKFFLSPKACRGILRRAEKRGRELPEALCKALRAVADGE